MKDAEGGRVHMRQVCKSNESGFFYYWTTYTDADVDRVHMWTPPLSFLLTSRFFVDKMASTVLNLYIIAR